MPWSILGWECRPHNSQNPHNCLLDLILRIVRILRVVFLPQLLPETGLLTPRHKPTSCANIDTLLPALTSMGTGFTVGNAAPTVQAVRPAGHGRKGKSSARSVRLAWHHSPRGGGSNEAHCRHQGATGLHPWRASLAPPWGVGTSRRITGGGYEPPPLV